MPLDDDVRACYAEHLANPLGVIVVEELIWKDGQYTPGRCGIFRDLEAAAKFDDSCDGNMLWVPKIIDDPDYGNRGKSSNQQ
jgi:hypothetical protein